MTFFPKQTIGTKPNHVAVFFTFTLLVLVGVLLIRDIEREKVLARAQSEAGDSASARALRDAQQAVLANREDKLRKLNTETKTSGAVTKKTTTTQTAPVQVSSPAPSKTTSQTTTKKSTRKTRTS